VAHLAQQSEKTMTGVPNELVLTRLIDAPREKLFSRWTEPALLKQWFAPAPGWGQCADQLAALAKSI
jgi:hypothetical protein